MNVNSDYLSAMCSSREKYIISKEQFEKLASGSLEDAIRALRENGFGEDSYIDAEDLVKSEEKKLINFIKEYSPNESYKQYKLLSYDYYNAEALLRCHYLNIEESKLMSIEGIYSISEIKGYIEKGKGEISSILMETIDKGKALFEKEEATGKALNNLFTKNKFKELLIVSKKFKKFVKVQIDILNISMAIRSKDERYLKESFIDGGDISLETCIKIVKDTVVAYDLGEYKEVALKAIEEGNNKRALVELENYSDSYTLKELMTRKYEAYGNDKFYIYCEYKGNEIRNARILFVGLAAEVGSSEIKMRLRENYAG